MIFSEFIDNVATILDTTSLNAGIFMSLLLTMSFVFITVLAAKGKSMITSLAISILLIVMFTMMEWLPTWTGGALALGLSLISAMVLSKTGSV